MPTPTEEDRAYRGLAGSPVSSRSSPRLRNSLVSAASGKPGRITAWAAATLSASGSRAHSMLSSSAACGSAFYPPSAQTGSQQLACLVPGERLDVQRAGGLGGKRAQLVAGLGHQHKAARTAGQHRMYLIGIVRVVDDDEHTLSRQYGAGERGLTIRNAYWNPRRRHAKCVEEAVERLTSCHRAASRVEAAHIHM